MSLLLMSADGYRGQIELYSNKVVIKRKGIMAFFQYGLKGDKEIVLKSITAVQFKKPNFLTYGYIQIAFSGSPESKKGYFNAFKDENTVMFRPKHLTKFIAIKEKIQELIG